MRKKELKKLTLRITTIAKVNAIKVKGGFPSDPPTIFSCFCDSPTLCGC